jgi:hypothetical protein
VFKMKKRGASATPGSTTREERKNLTLLFGYVYHIMNNTCIHMRTGWLNIYMYRRREIYREPLEKIQ